VFCSNRKLYGKLLCATGTCIFKFNGLCKRHSARQVASPPQGFRSIQTLNSSSLSPPHKMETSNNTITSISNGQNNSGMLQLTSASTAPLFDASGILLASHSLRTPLDALPRYPTNAPQPTQQGIEQVTQSSGIGYPQSGSGIQQPAPVSEPAVQHTQTVVAMATEVPAGEVDESGKFHPFIAVRDALNGGAEEYAGGINSVNYTFPISSTYPPVLRQELLEKERVRAQRNGNKPPVVYLSNLQSPSLSREGYSALSSGQRARYDMGIHPSQSAPKSCVSAVHFGMENQA